MLALLSAVAVRITGQTKGGNVADGLKKADAYGADAFRDYNDSGGDKRG